MSILYIIDIWSTTYTTSAIAADMRIRPYRVKHNLMPKTHRDTLVCNKHYWAQVLELYKAQEDEDATSYIFGLAGERGDDISYID